ncbi:DUF397 domain-containing protein [Wenjunlia tyrosinilytica]|uniref:DUF397 domain-containing protein n=1 Tax=Wenjunlia tyrosinilytica TaxID=1544741 RepID=A0A918E1F6_9ACTN|nr:DUF397 domain-containing protein [Wenjunlia tyrosinilytica]GGP00164.1 hypothetical protein GCM10012280_68320 [Wenjunlia tyrosinilytica]
MNTKITAPLEWRKSSYSGGNGQCVEFAAPDSSVVAVRDSKDPSGPSLSFSSEAWTSFVAGIGAGAFDTGR